jgi:hypothetical protein
MSNQLCLESREIEAREYKSVVPTQKCNLLLDAKKVNNDNIFYLQSPLYPCVDNLFLNITLSQYTVILMVVGGYEMMIKSIKLI